MQSKATSVEAYLASLPADRREAVQAVRETILRNLDKDIQEGMQYGMIGYYVPHRVFAPGYHCDPKQPLPYAGLASQKGHMSFYLMSAYGAGEKVRWLQDEFKKAGKKLDMGKCCIRFKKLEDLPLDVIGEAIRRVPASAHVEWYQKALDTRGKAANEGATKKAAKPTAEKATSARTRQGTKSTAKTKKKTAGKR